MKVGAKVTDGKIIGDVKEINDESVFVIDETQNMLRFDRSDLKLYIQLEDGEKQIDEERTIALGMVIQAFETLLPGVKKPEIHDESITAYDVDLYPTIYHKNGLGRVIENVGWQVSIRQYLPGDRETPPDVDVVDICEPMQYHQAVKVFVKTVADRLIEDYWQGVSDEEYAKLETV